RDRVGKNSLEGEDLQAKVLFVADAVGPTLQDPDLVVQPLHEAERHFVVRPAIRLDAVPVPLDQLRELPIRRQPLPPERLDPAIEEASRPARRLVAPELLKRLLEEVGYASTRSSFPIRCSTTCFIFAKKTPFGRAGAVSKCR